MWGVEPCQQLKPSSLATTKQGNEILHESLRELQNGTSNNPPPAEPHPLSAPSPTPSSSYLYVLEPSISLSDTRGRIFAASSIKLGISSVYNPNIMLVISLGSALLAPLNLLSGPVCAIGRDLIPALGKFSCPP